MIVDDKEKWKSMSTYPQRAKRLGLNQKFTSVLIRPCNFLPTVCSVGWGYVTYAYIIKALLIYIFYCRLASSCLEFLWSSTVL